MPDPTATPDLHPRTNALLKEMALEEYSAPDHILASLCMELERENAQLRAEIESLKAPQG
jgi:hypothetical protein